MIDFDCVGLNGLIYLFNFNSLELATWGGGLGVGASFGSTLAVLAHISLSRPLASQVGGGGTGVERHPTQRNVEMK